MRLLMTDEQTVRERAGVVGGAVSLRVSRTGRWGRADSWAAVSWVPDWLPRWALLLGPLRTTMVGMERHEVLEQDRVPDGSSPSAATEPAFAGTWLTSTGTRGSADGLGRAAAMAPAQRAAYVATLSRGHGNAAVSRVIARQGDNNPQEDGEGHFVASPNEGYLKAAVNWDAAAAGTAPSDPPDLTIRADPPGPVPIGFERIVVKGYFTSSNRLLANVAPLVQAYEVGAPAFRAAAQTLNGSWHSAAAQIRQFHTAKAQLGPDGALGPSPAGENWAPPSGGQTTLDQIAEDQMLSGGKRLGSLFDDASGQRTSRLEGVDDASLGKGTTEQRERTSKLFEAARGKDALVQDAIAAYAKHLDTTIPNAHRLVTTAIKSGAIASLDQDRTAGDDAKARLEMAKTAAVEEIAAASAILRSTASILTLPAGVSPASDMSGAAGVVASTIVAGTYNAKIAEAHERIIRVRTQIDAIRAQIAAEQIDSALASLDAAEKETDSKMHGIQLALNARKDAYAEAAKSAGEQVGGGEQGARVQSAINAIPRVQTVLGRVDAVLSQLKLPPYSEAAGKGLAAALANGDSRCDGATFVKMASWSKGYFDEFTGQRQTWQGRLTSLQAVVGKLNVPGT
jgi:hypothetical protein